MIRYLVPLFFIDILSLIRSLITNIPSISKISKNSKLRNTKKNKSVFVIANGPYLNNFDVTSLFGKEVIVMNNFNLCEWKEKVKIVAHCIGEPQSSSHWGEDQIKIMTETDSESYWFHISNYKDVTQNIFSKNKNCFYVASLISSRLWNPKLKINLSRPSLGYQTTAQMAIMVALHLGYKKINLIGFDHDWLTNRKISPHFYKERKGVIKSDLSKFSYYELINISKTMWEIYIKIKLTSKNMDSEITNLSNPSFLDVFDY